MQNVPDGGGRNKNVYPTGYVLFEKGDAGTFAVDVLQDGIFNIEAVSAGASGVHQDSGTGMHAYYEGATGGYFNGEVYLVRGSYSFVVGAAAGNNYTWNYLQGGSTYINLTVSDTNYFYMYGGGYNGGTSGGFITVPDPESLPTGTTYNQGYAGYSHGAAHDWYPSFGNAGAPVPSALGAYGQGGGAWVYYGYSGTQGYLKVTFLRGS